MRPLIAPGSIPRSLLRTFNFEIWKLKCLGACPEDLYSGARTADRDGSESEEDLPGEWEALRLSSGQVKVKVPRTALLKIRAGGAHFAVLEGVGHWWGITFVTGENGFDLHKGFTRPVFVKFPSVLGEPGLGRFREIAEERVVPYRNDGSLGV